ncbi:MAG: hypothetical protein V3U30_05895 [Thermoplasmata archaeon]
MGTGLETEEPPPHASPSLVVGPGARSRLLAVMIALLAIGGATASGQVTAVIPLPAISILHLA